jgi:hypothetical protein
MGHIHRPQMRISNQPLLTVTEETTWGDPAFMLFPPRSKQGVVALVVMVGELPVPRSHSPKHVCQAERLSLSGCFPNV